MFNYSTSSVNIFHISKQFGSSELCPTYLSNVVHLCWTSADQCPSQMQPQYFKAENTAQFGFILRNYFNHSYLAIMLYFLWFGKCGVDTVCFTQTLKVKFCSFSHECLMLFWQLHIHQVMVENLYCYFLGWPLTTARY